MGERNPPMAAKLIGEGIANPFARPHDAPVTSEVEEWARALCTAYGAKPDKLIGFPEAPAWRSWVGYAELAINAAAALGYERRRAA